VVVFQTIIETISLRPQPTSDWYITVVRLTEVDREQTSVWSNFLLKYIIVIDRLCGLVVRVPGYRSRGLGFDSLRY
jgi:hypothetical protein